MISSNFAMSQSYLYLHVYTFNLYIWYIKFIFLKNVLLSHSLSVKPSVAPLHLCLQSKFHPRSIMCKTPTRTAPKIWPQHSHTWNSQLANKHMETCSASLAIRLRKWKPRWDTIYTTNRVPKMKKAESNVTAGYLSLSSNNSLHKFSAPNRTTPTSLKTLTVLLLYVACIPPEMPWWWTDQSACHLVLSTS